MDILGPVIITIILAIFSLVGIVYLTRAISFIFEYYRYMKLYMRYYQPKAKQEPKQEDTKQKQTYFVPKSDKDDELLRDKDREIEVQQELQVAQERAKQMGVVERVGNDEKLQVQENIVGVANVNPKSFQAMVLKEQGRIGMLKLLFQKDRTKYWQNIVQVQAQETGKAKGRGGPSF